jgi:isoquinoline 1-oxidoreductase alpha subunit
MRFNGTAAAYRCCQEEGMVSFKLNGKPQQVDVPDDTPVLWVLRDTIGLTGTKFGCGIGMCGACTVHVDGEQRRGCLTPISSIAGSEITTIESIGNDRIGRAVQEAWVRNDVVQCGYCQSGQIMAAVAFLKGNKTPSDADITGAMSANLCRCGTYLRIHAAVKDAARAIATGEAK